MATYGFQSSACGRVPRRRFLADLGMGFTGLRSAQCSIAMGSPVAPLVGRRRMGSHISRRRPKASFGCS